MNNYFNFKKFNDQYLITNDFGRFHFLSNRSFKELVAQKTDINSELGAVLKDNLFLFDSSKNAFINKSIFHYRNAKNYLFYGTSLHIFVVTASCNMNCCYCQAQNANIISKESKTMNYRIAKKAADISLMTPQNEITVEFQGGEPLLNFEVIKYIINYMESQKADKKINYSIVSNLTLLTDDMVEFIKQHNISIATSIDGPEILHNLNRPMLNNNDGSYNSFKNAISMLRKYDIQVGAIQTTTKRSLQYAKEIVDAYIELGFNNIFIRPLTPLGYAKQNWSTIGYSAKEFVRFYKECLEYIIDLNKQKIKIRENQAAVFLSKILSGFSPNYMELRSPCGASTGQIAYYYDGNVFTCDEGRMLFEMGNSTFKLGNVFNNNYDDLMNSQVCKAVSIASVLEALPKCCDCVYQPYCGVCPVVNYAVDNDVFPRMQNYRCAIFSGILDIIFEIIQRNNQDEIAFFKGWSK